MLRATSPALSVQREFCSSKETIACIADLSSPQRSRFTRRHFYLGRASIVITTHLGSLQQRIQAHPGPSRPLRKTYQIPFRHSPLPMCAASLPGLSLALIPYLHHEWPTL